MGMNVATIAKRRTKSGIRFMAQVRVRPFKPASKSFDTKAAALRWADALERELRAQGKRGGVASDVTQMTVGQLIEQFRNEPDVQKLRYRSSLELLLAWWVNKYGADKILAFGVLRLREARDLLRPGRAPATVNRYLSAMRSCWNWGRTAGLVPQDMLWPSRLLMTEPRGRTRFLDDAELAQLLDAARGHSLTMLAAVVVSLACGVRQSELLRLTWADIDLDRQRMRLMLTKNNEARTVFLPSAAVDALRSLRRGPVVGAKHVFLAAAGKPLDKDALANRWNHVRAAAGLSDFRWHDLRHSCASFLAQQGANLLEIGAVLGHKSASITRRYAHLVEGAPVPAHRGLDLKLGGRAKP